MILPLIHRPTLPTLIHRSLKDLTFPLNFSLRNRDRHAESAPGWIIHPGRTATPQDAAFS